MPRYSDEIVDEVRQTNDIVDIISQYVHLKRSGRNFFGLCPFHNEKSPSFSVSPDKQIFHCFGCGVGGNVISFISKIDGIGFKESVEDDLGDDELNAFYKGYTEEDKDENSAYNKLKKNVKSIKESSYKKGDRVELDNGMTGTVTKDFDWENEDQVAVEIDGTKEMKYPRSETLKDLRESDEETPYTKEEVERDLKSITHNFTDKDGDVKCGFEEEKKFGVEILRRHYRIVEVSGDDRREGTWYHISFAEPLDKNESVDPSLLGDCPECGDKSFDTKKGRCTKCNYRE